MSSVKSPLDTSIIFAEFCSEFLSCFRRPDVDGKCRCRVCPPTLRLCRFSFFPIGESELAVGDFDRGQGGEFWNFPDRRSFGIFDEKKVGSRIFIISRRWSMYFLFFSRAFSNSSMSFHFLPMWECWNCEKMAQSGEAQIIS